MRRSKPVRIGELWSGFVKEHPAITRKLCESQVPELWNAIVGPSVVTLTTATSIKNGILQVSLSSSVARHELFMRRNEIRNEINKRLGMNIVTNIIVK